ncbi:MAG: hypothetical protein J4F48_00420 [Nitrospinae bacterium]|nr:hypothetical protein [Nitrospinota bacterium]
MNKEAIVSVRNGVISAVIAGIILMIVPSMREYVVRFLKWLWLGVLWCWGTLVSSYSLPGWIWLVVFAFPIFGAIDIFLGIKNAISEPVSMSKTDYRSYVEDSMFGAIWRWRWEGNAISDLCCYCPRCDGTLVSNYLFGETEFLCENCNHSVRATIRGGDKYYAIGAVEREIGRRIRTSEYKNAEQTPQMD